MQYSSPSLPASIMAWLPSACGGSAEVSCQLCALGTLMKRLLMVRDSKIDDVAGLNCGLWLCHLDFNPGKKEIKEPSYHPVLSFYQEDTLEDRESK